MRFVKGEALTFSHECPYLKKAERETMSQRDFYEVLGVDRGADAGTIKKAYRKLAMKYHPGQKSWRSRGGGQVQRSRRGL